LIYFTGVVIIIQVGKYVKENRIAAAIEVVPNLMMTGGSFYAGRQSSEREYIVLSIENPRI
jgi:hypothetical protein